MNEIVLQINYVIYIYQKKITVSFIIFRLQSTFIQKIIELFREKLASKFPECRLPIPKPLRLQTREPSNDKVIVYTANVRNGLFANVLIRGILKNGNVAFEERSCSKDPKYVKELQELVGDDKMIRFPMVIVNGRDLCGEDEFEGLEDFGGRGELKSALNLMYASQMHVQSMNKYMKKTGSIIGWE